MTDTRNDRNQKVVEEFRANGGVVGGMFEGRNLLLLTTIGAKSGRERLSPLVYTRDGDRLVIAASYGGAPTSPAWFHNLVANPKVTVEVGTEKFEATATVVQDRAERDRLYAGMVAHAPGFADYEKKTDRVIPVVVLER
ncbi:deazaflavin-dependent oxidoreductase (nitroreductase family) [Saccharothrix tamanrassetensis]|uniref:Deazaflavin-dependent oxidoreductase (Nitroreductase family) n=1 Tax=Saccharothrix tamanrassetensis TaxID=1051531 RepID=A0A841C586_9PSEU|nr:nitroreductase family deazaflavin-dependent oxidoreductase [Saccharothrix tamanrassetensis]MBB5953692.1 deazaflavin-dependent oxidoreductase (nitroreductase family) [Saccharothrix tamanrassetensis]